MAEPAQRRADDTGGRFYEHPTRTEPVPDRPDFQRPAQYISVTTALNVKAKPNLVFWAGSITAARAMGDLPKLMASILKPGCGRSRARKDPLGCGDCVECVETWLALTHHGEKSRRAREGTAAHDVFELWIGTGIWRYIPELTGDPAVDQYVPTAEVMAPYIARLQEWVADFGLTPDDFHVSECTVWNHRLRYAGTLDAIVTIHPRTKKAADFCARINLAIYQAAHVDPAEITANMLARPVRVLVDAKSREGDGAAIYTEHRLQLVAYRNAETMTPKGRASDIEEPMLETDAAAILQVRPDGYTFRPVVTDGPTMRAFEEVLALARWDADAEEGALVRAFPLPDGWTWAPPTYARATTPDGKLCGCAACDDPASPDCLFAGAGARPSGQHVREVTAAGDPVEPKKAARKRAPAKKAAAKAAAAAERRGVTSPLADLKHSFTGGRADIPDDAIPF